MNRTSNRIEKLRKSLKADRADALLVASVTNVSYLTGFTGDDSTFLLTPTAPSSSPTAATRPSSSRNAPTWRFTSGRSASR